jgi:F0F1-type ATP synthase assembly protein I
MSSPDSGKGERKQYFVNLTMAAVAGQVGCLTLGIVLVAVFLGLWLDNHFDTKPVLTLILVFGSLPLSLILMFGVARGAIKKMKINSSSEEEEKSKHKEENNLDRG